MGARRWRWLRVRILGLVRSDTRIARALTPEQTTPGKPRR